MPRITEIKKVEISKDCFDFPIFIEWNNKIGGKDQWLFYHTNTETTKTKQLNKYVHFVEDLETSIGQEDIVGKTAAPEIQFGANVHESKMDGIRSLYESPKVLILVNPNTWQTDGPSNTPLPKWKRVLIKTGSFVFFRTKQQYYQVKMTATLPLTNNLNE
jgi:hypothetical protein